IMAKNKAWVAGVLDVDAGDLNVEWWAAQKLRREHFPPDVSDSAIQASVHDALVYDPRTAASGIDVEVDEGIVTLSGEVDNLEAKLAAEDNARNTVGVRMVKNYLFADITSPSDRDIESEVLAALRRDPVVERHEIRPVVRNKKAYLYGTVDSYYEKAHAGTVVSRVKGVAAIQNNISVPQTWQWKSDKIIRRNIRQEFFWSGHVDENDLDIDVENSVATLEGEVDTWAEYHAAVDNAFDAGARVVKSKMEVAGREIPRGQTYYFDSYHYNPGVGMY
ncbi:MAG: BON domain-containing protein, partial [Chitinivibrionales bacterium]|nr:BON domain-containing protein [Chitinivibrionales bacterium]